MEKKVLNISNAIHIDLPKLNKHDSFYSNPKEYWNLYNRGESLYKKKKYSEAKDIFLKVLKYPNPHKTFRIYLLRTYRKLIKTEIEDEKFIDAYNSFLELFKFCADDITNTDRRKFNKVVKKLVKIDPKLNYHEIELIEEPDIQISGSEDQIYLLNEIRFTKNNDPRILNWDILNFLKYNTLYASNKLNESFFKIRNYNGDLRTEFKSNHSFYRFNYSEKSDKFITSSEDLILYLYSINTGYIKSYDLKLYSEHKYHLRCIDISPDGNLILFSNVDEAYLMNSDFEIFNIFLTPHKDGLIKRVVGESYDRSEIEQNMVILGLSGNPDNKEIKNAFKKLVIKYHPDQNPDDMYANERMREIINAYENLTNEKAENVFIDSEKVVYYRHIHNIKVNIPNTDFSFNIEMGVTAPPEDWIYSTYLGSEYIYLGCYSGKLYKLSKNGNVKTVYNCHDVLKSIKERNNYLFIGTDYYLYILRDDKYLNHVKIGKSNLFWVESGFILKESNELKIFSNEGLLKSTIKFKNKIYDLYFTKNGLNVSTTNKTFVISFKIDNDNLDLNSNSNFDSISLNCKNCGTENIYYANFCQNCGKIIKFNVR